MSAVCEGSIDPTGSSTIPVAQYSGALFQEWTDKSPFTSAFDPAAVWPFPKAEPRTATNKERKKRKTAILTDTPTKRDFEEERDKSCTTPFKEACY